MSYNRIIVVGNVGRDAEMRFTKSGRGIANFSVAVNYRRRSRDTDQFEDETEWFRVDCWEPMAESASQYAVKGRKVLVEGRFKSNKYTGSDGTERTSNDIVASRVVYLGGGPGDEGGSGGGGGMSGEAPPPPSGSDADSVEDLPF